MALSISITRLYSSLDFILDQAKAATFDNYRGHNMEDSFSILDGDKLVLAVKVQTVANMQDLEKGAAFLHTIEPGEFFIRAFVPQRQFYGDIHGIVGAKTMAGELIDYNSITATNPYRWLVHDTQKKREYPDGSKFGPGIAVRSAWSDGCFIMTQASLTAVSAAFKKHGIKKDQLVPTILKMEGRK